jgi:putative membrane protein
MMGGGFTMWPLLVLFWVALIALIVFLVAKLLPRSGRPGHRPPPSPGAPPESPEQILDRMFAVGEIDEATYRARRTALAEMRRPS